MIADDDRPERPIVCGRYNTETKKMNWHLIVVNYDTPEIVDQFRLCVNQPEFNKNADKN